MMYADFYLIAYKVDEQDEDKPFSFRVDRIEHITEHRKQFVIDQHHDFDEGLLCKRAC